MAKKGNKHFNINYCKKHDRFTIKGKGAWANNFSKALTQMVVVNDGGGMVTHRHPNLDETYTIINTPCDLCK